MGVFAREEEKAGEEDGDAEKEWFRDQRFLLGSKLIPEVNCCYVIVSDFSCYLYNMFIQGLLLAATINVSRKQASAVEGYFYILI